jgi:hypothetical protein
VQTLYAPNPFTTGIVESKQIFYDRESELKQLFEIIAGQVRAREAGQTGFRQSVSVAGARNSGKSSLVVRCLANLREVYQQILPVRIQLSSKYTLLNLYADILLTSFDALAELTTKDLNAISKTRHFISSLIRGGKPQLELIKSDEDKRDFAFKLKLPNLMSLVGFPTDLEVGVEYRSEVKRNLPSIQRALIEDLNSIEEYVNALGFKSIILVIDDIHRLYEGEDFDPAIVRDFLQTLRTAVSKGLDSYLFVFVGLEDSLSRLIEIEKDTEDLLTPFVVPAFGKKDVDNIIQLRLNHTAQTFRMPAPTFSASAIEDMSASFDGNMNELMQICKLCYDRGTATGTVSQVDAEVSTATVRLPALRSLLSRLRREGVVTDFEIEILKQIAQHCGTASTPEMVDGLQARFKDLEASSLRKKISESLNRLVRSKVISKDETRRPVPYSIDRSMKRLMELDFGIGCGP